MLRVLLVFVGIPAGIALAIFGGMAAVNAANLQSQGKLVQATVTQSQTDENHALEIKYKFRVAGGSGVYTHADETGRKDLWVNVSKPAGTSTQVRYLPSNPWVNIPVDTTSKPLESDLTAAVAGALIAIVGISLAASDISKMRKRKASVASTSTAA
jgi:hypothetical protein